MPLSDRAKAWIDECLEVDNDGGDIAAAVITAVEAGQFEVTGEDDEEEDYVNVGINLKMVWHISIPRADAAAIKQGL